MTENDVQPLVLQRTRHVLGISGGKDSAALAIYLKMAGRIPDIEYFFSDTGSELREVYEYLDKLEDYLGKPIARLSSGRDFDHFLKVYNNYLPSPRARWCTREMKLKPFEKFVANDPCISYIAIRADEFRQGYISHKPNIKPVYPFIEDGIVKADVFRILEESVGIPDYYKWRSRSGCYFCFFQRRDEWVGLADNHPDLFEKAKQYEKTDPETGKRFTWVQGITLDELISHREEILKKSSRAQDDKERSQTWQERVQLEDEDDPACLICTL